MPSVECEHKISFLHDEAKLVTKRESRSYRYGIWAFHVHMQVTGHTSFLNKIIMKRSQKSLIYAIMGALFSDLP
jgi:hypothetical protein